MYLVYMGRLGSVHNLGAWITVYDLPQRGLQCLDIAAVSERFQDALWSQVLLMK